MKTCGGQEKVASRPKVLLRMMNIVNALTVITCHECTSKYKVEKYKEYIVLKKEELIIKKDMRNKAIMKEKIT